MKTIKTTKAPAAIGPYSQGIQMHHLVFSSGQIPLDPATGEMAGTIEEQTRQSLTNVSEILKAAGTDMNHVIHTTVYLSDLKNFTAMNEVYAEFFRTTLPARSCVEVAALPKNAMVEIEVIAFAE